MHLGGDIGAGVSAVRVLSLQRQGSSGDGAGGSSSGATVEAPLSEAALLDGLAWLAAQAPSQPQLQVRTVRSVSACLRGFSIRSFHQQLRCQSVGNLRLIAAPSFVDLRRQQGRSPWSGPHCHRSL